jgi:BirA family biotin operon repressor/biotin-[acetyl-CoA-carboxylase] ligase
MDDARRIAAAPGSDGLVVGADSQAAGRGRHGRRWLSRPGDDLLVSVVLRPTDARLASGLSMLAGLAAARAIDRLAGVRSTIKWPNDVRIAGRKVCGVLVETSIEGAAFSAVVGFGINVNLDPAAWPGIASAATSLAQVRGRPQSRVQALACLLEEIDRLYGASRGTPAPGAAVASIRDEWAARLETVGREVELVSAGEVVRGLAEGVDDDGSLVVRLDDGATRKFAAGEVTLQSPR